MFRRFFRILAIVALVAATPLPALAQAAPDPADPFFDGSVLHDLFITINSRDWASLKEHFLDNTYYPADFKWNGQTVRNIGIRSRGTGSRSGVKPGPAGRLRPLHHRPEIPRLEVVHPSEQHAGSERHARAAEHGAVRAHGLWSPSAKRTRGLYINNAYVGLFTIVESIDKPFLSKKFNENDGHLRVQLRQPRRGAVQLRLSRRRSRRSTPVPFKPETLELDPQGEVLERLFWTINIAGDAVWRTSIEEFLDVKKFIRHLAIENFLAEEDGLTGDYGPNNFYFYRFLNTNRYTFLPWDKSNTFWESPSYSILRNIEDGTGEQAQPAGGARAAGRRAARAVAEHDQRVRRLDRAAGPRHRPSAPATPGSAAVRSDADIESDPRCQLRGSVTRGLYERGFRRVDPLPDELGADAERHRARAGGRGPGEARHPVGVTPRRLVRDRTGAAARRSAR